MPDDVCELGCGRASGGLVAAGIAASATEPSGTTENCGEGLRAEGEEITEAPSAVDEEVTSPRLQANSYRARRCCSRLDSISSGLAAFECFVRMVGHAGLHIAPARARQQTARSPVRRRD